MTLLCLRCACTYQPAHELADYCRSCDVYLKKLEASRRSSRERYQAIKADPEKRAEYNAYMRETMRHRRAAGLAKPRKKKETA